MRVRPCAFQAKRVRRGAEQRIINGFLSASYSAAFTSRSWPGVPIMALPSQCQYTLGGEKIVAISARPGTTIKSVTPEQAGVKHCSAAS